MVLKFDVRTLEWQLFECETGETYGACEARMVRQIMWQCLEFLNPMDCDARVGVKAITSNGKPFHTLRRRTRRVNTD